MPRSVAKVGDVETDDGGSRLVVSGVYRCQRRECVLCGPETGLARRELVDRAARTWAAAGGRVLLVTATVRADPWETGARALRRRYEAVSGAWSRLGRAMKRERELAPCGAWVRGIEETFDVRRGWHVHVHAAVWVWDRVRHRTLKRALQRAWVSAARAEGLYAHDRHGLHSVVWAARGSSSVASYVWGLGAELGSAGKRGKRGATLPELAARGDWVHWTDATRAIVGVHRVAWSRGACGAVEGLDELGAWGIPSPELERPPPVYRVAFAAPAWRWAHNSGLWAQLVSVWRDSGWAAAAAVWSARAPPALEPLARWGPHASSSLVHDILDDAARRLACPREPLYFRWKPDVSIPGELELAAGWDVDEFVRRVVIRLDDVGRMIAERSEAEIAERSKRIEKNQKNGLDGRFGACQAALLC